MLFFFFCFSCRAPLRCGMPLRRVRRIKVRRRSLQRGGGDKAARKQRQKKKDFSSKRFFGFKTTAHRYCCDWLSTTGGVTGGRLLTCAKKVIRFSEKFCISLSKGRAPVAAAACDAGEARIETLDVIGEPGGLGDAVRPRAKTPLRRDDIEPARTRPCTAGSSPAALSGASTASLSTALAAAELLGSQRFESAESSRRQTARARQASSARSRRARQTRTGRAGSGARGAARRPRGASC